MADGNGEGPSVRRNRPDDARSGQVEDDAARQLSQEAGAAQASRAGSITEDADIDDIDEDDEGADDDVYSESQIEIEGVGSDGLRADERSLLRAAMKSGAFASSPSSVLKGKGKERQVSSESPESPDRPTAEDLVLEKDEEILALQVPFEKILGSIYPEIGIKHDPWDLYQLIADIRDIGVFDYMKKIDPRKRRDFTKWSPLHYQTALVVFDHKYDEIDPNGEALEEKDLWLLPEIFKAIFKEASKEWIGGDRWKAARKPLPSPDDDSLPDEDGSDALQYTTEQLRGFVHHHSYQFNRGLKKWMEGVNAREDDLETIQRRIVAAIKPLGIEIDMEGIEVRDPAAASASRKTKKRNKRDEESEDEDSQEESEEEAPARPKPARKKSTTKPTGPKIKKTNFIDKNGKVCHFHVQGKKGLVIVKCRTNCGTQIHSSCMLGQKSKTWTCPECELKDKSEFTVPEDEVESDESDGGDTDAPGNRARPIRKASGTRAKPQQSSSKAAKPVAKKPTQQAKDGKRKRMQQESDGGEDEESAGDDVEEEPEPRPTKVRKVGHAAGNPPGTKVVNGVLVYPSGRPMLPEPRAFARGTIAGFNSKGNVIKIRR